MDESRPEKSDLQIEQLDSLRFSYDILSKNELHFEKIPISSILNLDVKGTVDDVLIRISSDKRLLSRNKKLTFFNSEYNDSMMILTNAGKFQFNQSIYYYFFHSNMYYDCFECASFLSLYRYDKKSNHLANIPIGYQASDTPYCFGDFDKDGNLDYLNWDFGDKAEMYTINADAELVKNKKYIITIDVKEPGIYYINRTKSIWMNDL